MKLRSKFRYLIWLIPLPLLWWSWHDIPFQQVLARFSQLQFWQIATLILVNVAMLVSFSLRWWLLLRSDGYRPPFFALSAYRQAGAALSYFTPGPQLGGEPLQVYLVHQRQQIPVSIAVATVTLEKLVELLANFTFLTLGILVIAGKKLLNASISQLLIIGSSALLFLPFGYLLLIQRGWTPLSSFLKTTLLHRHSSPKVETIYRFILDAEEQLSCFCRERFGLLIFGYIFSLCLWGSSILEFWLAAGFLGFSLGIDQIVVALTVARLAFLFPVPGGLGTLEAGLILAAKALGLSPVFGASLALLIRLRDVGFATLGLWLGAWLTQSRYRGVNLPSQASE